MSTIEYLEFLYFKIIENCHINCISSVADTAYVDVATEIVSQEVPGAYPLNSVQREAVDTAVKQPFTVIQGPPGTGKTALVARLTYIFSVINDSFAPADNLKGIRQVMVCGPSNKSVDVITGKVSFSHLFILLCERLLTVGWCHY